KNSEIYFSLQILSEHSDKSEIKFYSAYQVEKSQNFSDYKLNQEGFPSQIMRNTLQSAHVLHWSKRLSENKAWMLQALAFTKNQPESSFLVDKNHISENVQLISEQFQGDINSKW